MATTTDPGLAKTVDLSVDEVVLELDLNRKFLTEEIIDKIGRTMENTVLLMNEGGALVKEVTLKNLTGFLRVRFVFNVDRYKPKTKDGEEQGCKAVSIDDIFAKLVVDDSGFSINEVVKEIKFLFARNTSLLVVRENNKVVEGNRYLPGIGRIKIGTFLTHSDSPDYVFPEDPAPQRNSQVNAPDSQVNAPDSQVNAPANQVNALANQVNNTAAELLIEGVMLYSHKTQLFKNILKDPLFAALRYTGDEITTSEALRKRWNRMRDQCNQLSAAELDISGIHHDLLKVLVTVRNSHKEGIARKIYDPLKKNKGFGHWVAALHANEGFSRLYIQQTVQGTQLGRKMTRVKYQFRKAPNDPPQGLDANANADADAGNSGNVNADAGNSLNANAGDG